MVGETQFQQLNHSLALQEEFGNIKIEQRESREHTLVQKAPASKATPLSSWTALTHPVMGICWDLPVLGMPCSALP